MRDFGQHSHPIDFHTLAWLAVLALALGVYLFGLSGQYVPSNGDELVYAHIARLTAASDHWLPLVSELDHMRNTKPPLLFWQAMVAGDWGRNWSLAALRTPSVMYTFLLAGAVAWTVYRNTLNLGNACIAASVYLAFFCTFRFGRTYLTSAPETFWLSLPMFWLLWTQLRQGPLANAQGLGWLTHAGFGLALGFGLAYKSFALIAPAGATLWFAQILSAPVLNWRTAVQTTLKVSLSAALALGVFAMWFVLDPDPGAVWQEFVIGENAGKLSSSRGYWQIALAGGGFSIWAQLLAYVQNAGMLAFVVLGLAGVGFRFGVQAWKGRHNGANGNVNTNARLSPVTLILLAWLAVWLIVFTLPSQRSARYVIPAMPALAMLIALNWDRIARGWFLASLMVCGVCIGVMGRIAWAAHDLGIGTDTELSVAMSSVLLGLGLVVLGSMMPSLIRGCTVAASLLVFACFSLITVPLNGAAGLYGVKTIAHFQGARIAVPNGFNGQFERFQFLLPGNQFVPYDAEGRAITHSSDSSQQALHRLLVGHDAVIWLQSEPSEKTPPCVPGCNILGERWEVKGRHQSGEITLANLWYPQNWLFRREWLVQRAGSVSPKQALE